MIWIGLVGVSFLSHLWLVEIRYRMDFLVGEFGSLGARVFHTHICLTSGMGLGLQTTT